ncbi:MAG TPA: carboxymuconolactone decarboxylase family protein [Longimicrobiales bacterium]
MDEAVRSVVALSAALGAGDRERLTAALDRAAEHADAVAIEEALLQSYLFLGYPAALNALALWRERHGRPAAPATEDDWAGWRARGERVCERVYAGAYGRLRENVARLHPDMERWMLTEGYGKVLGRPGLELKVRELCIAVLLAGQDAAPQLHAHLRGALNAGATPAEVEEALALAFEVLPAERVEAARETWGAVRRRWAERCRND